MRITKRLRMWRRRRQFEQDLAEEVRIHRELSGTAAFGSEALALEQSRDVWGFAWLDSWKQDVRYAVRGLRRSPGFAIAVIAAIALGIGLNTTLFTVFNAYALRPHAVRDPYSLRAVVPFEEGSMGRFLAIKEWETLREQRAFFTDVLAFDNFGGDLAGRAVFAQFVSDNYFPMLGVEMELGRPLLPGDENMLVLGNDAWRNKFGADRSIVGKKLYMRGQPLEVVGVAAAGFSGLETVPTGVWIPLAKLQAMRDEPPSVRTVARLRPGVPVGQAEAGLLPWARRYWPRATSVKLPLHATSIPITRETLLAFLPVFVAFFLVLAIACANVSNMMLARGLARQREVAIRVSLGAGRWRLVRQLLTESVILAIPAAAAGFFISQATIAGARRALFETAPPAFVNIVSLVDLAPDWRVFGYVLAVAVSTALLFGLMPALQTTRSRIVEANRGDFSSDYRPARLRSLLVVGQVAVCALLLILCAIVLRSEGRVSRQELGLDTTNVWDVRAMPRYQARVAARLREEPAVEVVANAWRAPLYGPLRRLSVTPSGSGQPVASAYNFVSGGYFDVFRIPLARGRQFTAAESDAEAPVVVVSEAAARRFWPGRDGVGEAVAIPPAPVEDSRFNRWPPYASARVIGVAKDVMTGGPDEVCIYFATGARSLKNDSVLLRMNTGVDAKRRIAGALEQIAPSVSDFLLPMEDVRAIQVYPFQVTSRITGFLAGVALLLTVTGIYGVMSYLVTERAKEIGIRVALGASAPAILWMVLRQSGKLSAIGALIGGGLALAISPLAANQILEVHPYEALPYAAAVIVVFVAAVAASVAPSRRAVRIDPVVTLRGD